jgi:hypothetical protein
VPCKIGSEIKCFERKVKQNTFDMFFETQWKLIIGCKLYHDVDVARSSVSERSINIFSVVYLVKLQG